MKIVLKELDRQTRRRRLLLDLSVDVETTRESDLLSLSEDSDLTLRLEPNDPVDFNARILVGNVLVASTRECDRPDFLLRQPHELADDEHDHFFCSGKLLRDWVGLSDLTVELGRDENWQPILSVPLSVKAAKIEQEAFEDICNDLADHSAAVLMDVYGKTFLGLEPERRQGESAPVALLQRLRKTLEQLASALREIASQPAYRLKTRRFREPTLTEQAVSDLTLEYACVDPSLVVGVGASVRFREQIREEALQTFDIPEHRVISGFLGFLHLQLIDLSSQMRRDRDMRQERRSYRNQRNKPGEKTWWETEDLPRIEGLDVLLREIDRMKSDLVMLRRHSFLPSVPPLQREPGSSPLFRAHRSYARLFRIVLAHFQAFRVRLDDAYLLTRAKSLPVLYEWWCALQVLRILQENLFQRSQDVSRGSPFHRLKEDRDRFVIEFAPNQAVDFDDAEGRLVRFRYQPYYYPLRRSEGSTFGLLGAEQERTPDLAVEIFGEKDSEGQAPELIIVLDAKYSSMSHLDKLRDVRDKYGRIGVFQTGQVLSRQVWALHPGEPSFRERTEPSWAACCTVDNSGFWSDRFDMSSSVAGVVQSKPRLPYGPPPLSSLIKILLSRSGVVSRSQKAVAVENKTDHP